jgi:CRP/FNR family cyclic AMP-dependent transcriptional regulator
MTLMMEKYIVLWHEGHVNRIFVLREEGIQCRGGNLSSSVRHDWSMAGDRVDETVALREFRQRYRKSEVIFEEGSTGSEMYLINSGRVLLSVWQDEAKQTRVVVLNLGDFFGEMALMDDSSRSASASAVEDDTELVVMNRARFLLVARQQPEFALSLMYTLCQRLRGMNKRLCRRGASR